METSAFTSLTAVAAAIGCWLLILAGHPVWAFFSAIAGLVLGFATLFTAPAFRSPLGAAGTAAIVIAIAGIAILGIMFGRIFL